MRVSMTEDGREVALYTMKDRSLCPFCNVIAIVPLTPKQLAEQPDDTTHVCHPALGGCNHGFALD